MSFLSLSRALTRRAVRTLRLVVVGGAISYRALFNWTTPPMFIGTLLVGPLLQLLFFVFIGRQLGSPATASTCSATPWSRPPPSASTAAPWPSPTSVVTARSARCC
ncbi:hypothetical protein ACFU6I_26540 [Streptomyces sp. NPDC057486]|uniref:hypothetical protein n=1 Tax=Streptomyces sp. NPDC057486 TaxID=3346145 RepID=UPI0036A91514